MKHLSHYYLAHVVRIFYITQPEFPILPSVHRAIFVNSGRFLNFTELIGCPHEAEEIKLPQICLNEAAIVSISLWKAIIEAISRKCLHFARHFTPLDPHSPRLVPQACSSCLRQFETLVSCTYNCNCDILWQQHSVKSGAPQYMDQRVYPQTSITISGFSFQILRRGSQCQFSNFELPCFGVVFLTIIIPILLYLR